MPTRADRSPEGNKKMKSPGEWPIDPRQVTLSQWLHAAFNDGKRLIDDIHFDELSGPWDQVRQGKDWIPLCCQLLQDVVDAVPQYDNLRGVRTAVVALPMESTQKLKLWKESFWQSAGLGYEPPSLLLLKNSAFDEHFDEEYYRVLQISQNIRPNVTAAFRSYRSFLETDVEVSFENCIYVVACVSDT
jgi:hypothetical protein